LKSNHRILNGIELSETNIRAGSVTSDGQLLNWKDTLSKPPADICLPIHAGPESTVITKIYVNMLAVDLLAAHQLVGQDVEPLK
jgi:hypothetical protein